MWYLIVSVLIVAPLLTLFLFLKLRNSCVIGCPPVPGDNPRALASGLSYVQADTPTNMVQLFYTTYISVDRAHSELFCAKADNGGIMWVINIVQETFISAS